MPPLNSLWVFTQDWAVPALCLTRYGNDTLKESFGAPDLHKWLEGRADRDSGKWVEHWHAFNNAEVAKINPIIPAGTVVSFNRYHASNSGDVEMTLQFHSSPAKHLTPKKRKGTGKGHMRFYLNLDEFNSLGEMEPFTDE